MPLYRCIYTDVFEGGSGTNLQPFYTGPIHWYLFFHSQLSIQICYLFSSPSLGNRNYRMSPFKRFLYTYIYSYYSILSFPDRFPFLLYFLITLSLHLLTE